MPYRHDTFAPDQIYDIYNRGVDGIEIFVRPENYFYLLRKAKRLLEDLPIGMLAYCLMPNHYHFVLQQEDEVPISTFIQRLFQTYTQAFNKEQERRGPLCEGRFRHVHVDRDETVIHLCRYVHLNPVTAGLVEQPSDWPYSNYLEWIEARPGILVDRSFIRQYFSAPADYVAFVAEAVLPEKKRELSPYLLAP